MKVVQVIHKEVIQQVKMVRQRMNLMKKNYAIYAISARKTACLYHVDIQHATNASKFTHKTGNKNIKNPFLSFFNIILNFIVKNALFVTQRLRKSKTYHENN